ncbi:TPA: ArsR family transcriptional regulator [Candidatus Bathyarchaeota archaeon]|nr:ArsR family transcriptional regulator [Candidatus Bathyarchaeota archaeon]
MTKSQASKLSKRLERLVKTEICPAEDVSQYAQELRELITHVADEKTVKMESRFFKALSDETRIKILKLLSLRRMCVCEIMVALNLTQPTASHHLRILENAGIVNDEREGKWIFYSIANPKVTEILEKIENDFFID